MGSVGCIGFSAEPAMLGLSLKTAQHYTPGFFDFSIFIYISRKSYEVQKL
jgi:hypothetical protein